MTNEKLVIPYWMRTSVGRWLARHWGPAARRWKQEMDRALLRAADRELWLSNSQLQIALHVAVATHNGLQSEEFLNAVVRWKNASARVSELEKQVNDV